MASVMDRATGGAIEAAATALDRATGTPPGQLAAPTHAKSQVTHGPPGKAPPSQELKPSAGSGLAAALASEFKEPAGPPAEEAPPASAAAPGPSPLASAAALLDQGLRTLSGRSAAAAPDGGRPKHARPRHLSVILHGKRADDPDVRGAVEVLRGEGVAVDVKVTWECGDVDRFVKDILRDGRVETIVAAGGDGTLNEVVGALLHYKAPRSVAVGLLPMGTSNDFAAVTGLPQDLEGALRLCAEPGSVRLIDVGLLNGEVFMNTATLGASSELGAETSHEAKQALGPAAYLIKGVARLVQYEAANVTLRCPAEDYAPPLAGQNQQQQQQHALGAGAGAAAEEGGAAAEPGGPRTVSGGGGGGCAKAAVKRGKRGGVVELKERVLNLTAGNNRQVASMLQACPDALLDDGLLDITYVVGNPSESAGALFSEILSKGLAAACPEQIRTMRVPWLEITSDVPLPANRDGEPVEATSRFLLEALPRRIAMHLPPAADHLLVAQGGAALSATNLPRMFTSRALRKGAFKAMWAQVTRFRRVTRAGLPWWRAAVGRLLRLLPPVALGAALGYTLSRRRPQEQEGGQGGPQQLVVAGVDKIKRGARRAKKAVTGQGDGKQQ